MEGGKMRTQNCGAQLKWMNSSGDYLAIEFWNLSWWIVTWILIPPWLASSSFFFFLNSVILLFLFCLSSFSVLELMRNSDSQSRANEYTAEAEESNQSLRYVIKELCGNYGVSLGLRVVVDLAHPPSSHFTQTHKKSNHSCLFIAERIFFFYL